MENKNCNATVAGFTMSYLLLNLQLKNEYPRVYDFGLICIRIEELNNGFKAKKIFKPCKTHTRINYIAIENAEDLEEEFKKLEAELKQLDNRLNI